MRPIDSCIAVAGVPLTKARMFFGCCLSNWPYRWNRLPTSRMCNSPARPAARSTAIVSVIPYDDGRYQVHQRRTGGGRVTPAVFFAAAASSSLAWRHHGSPCSPQPTQVNSGTNPAGSRMCEIRKENQRTARSHGSSRARAILRRRFALLAAPTTFHDWCWVVVRASIPEV